MRAPVARLKDRCCGCGSCAAACPADCIGMRADAEGFLHSVVDGSRCTGCGACGSVCPALSARGADAVLSVRWATSPDGRLLSRSSSGGVYGTLALHAIGSGGAAYGAAWDHRCRSVAHRRAADERDLAGLLMSKYLQSAVGIDVYRAVERDLRDGTEVVYCGTACQVAGLIGYLECRRVPREGLIAVDVVCHGAPSPLLWRRWAAHVGRRHLSGVASVEFRRKDPSWEGYSVAYRLSSGREVLVPHRDDWYMAAFLSDSCCRPSCASCPAKGRCGSDITLGDFWGIGREHPEVDRGGGVSAVICRTGAGEAAIGGVSSLLESGLSSYDAVLRGNPSLERSNPAGPERGALMADVARGLPAAAIMRRHPLGLPLEGPLWRRALRAAARAVGIG